MTVECPRCANHGQQGHQWHATGVRNTNRHGRRRAVLICDVCGYAFSSGLPAAMAAAEAIGPDDYVPPIDEETAVVPQPSIPGTRVLQPSPFTKVDELAVDWKQK